MMEVGLRRLMRGILAGMMLLGLPAMWFLAPQTAFAWDAGCRTDPIVFVSDGPHLHINVAIGAPEESVASITYTIHGPVGTRADRIVYTGRGHGLDEHVVYLPDAAPETYVISTLVRAADPQTPVTVQVRGHGRAVSGDGFANSEVRVTIAP